MELLENRIVLSVTPTLVDLNPLGGSNPTDFTVIGDLTYFVAEDGTHGLELWKTDGTAEGTSMVRDIRSGSESSHPQQLTELNGELYFFADDGSTGLELWKSNGTSEGTVLVRDIREGSESAFGNYSELEASGNLLFFNADDGVHGDELWKSDGTFAGTALVKDLINGSGVYSDSSNIRELTDFNGTLFFAANDGANGDELWMSNGTESGTVMVKDAFPGTYPYYYSGYYAGPLPNSSGPRSLTVANGLLFFIAGDDNGVELWRSDGSGEGTFQLRDINPGPTDAFNPQSDFEVVGNLLLFTADDGTHGDELWRSDGTTDGTVLVKDINPGSEGNLSNFADLTDFDGTLFFSASDGTNGANCGNQTVRNRARCSSKIFILASMAPPVRLLTLIRITWRS